MLLNNHNLLEAELQLECDKFRAAKPLTKALAPHDEEQEVLLSKHHTPHHFASVSVSFSSVSDNW